MLTDNGFVPCIFNFTYFYEDLEDDNISLEQFTEKYGNNFLDILNEFRDDVLVYDEYRDFIFYIFKLHKNVFNNEHKPKFEIIELGKK